MCSRPLAARYRKTLNRTPNAGDFEEQDFGEGLRPGRLHLIGGRGMGRDPPANVGPMAALFSLSEGSRA